MARSRARSRSTRRGPHHERHHHHDHYPPTVILGRHDDGDGDAANNGGNFTGRFDAWLMNFLVSIHRPIFWLFRSLSVLLGNLWLRINHVAENHPLADEEDGMSAALTRASNSINRPFPFPHELEIPHLPESAAAATSTMEEEGLPLPYRQSTLLPAGISAATAGRHSMLPHVSEDSTISSRDHGHSSHASLSQRHSSIDNNEIMHLVPTTDAATGVAASLSQGRVDGPENAFAETVQQQPSYATVPTAAQAAAAAASSTTGDQSTSVRSNRPNPKAPPPESSGGETAEKKTHRRHSRALKRSRYSLSSNEKEDEEEDSNDHSSFSSTSKPSKRKRTRSLSVNATSRKVSSTNKKQKKTSSSKPDSKPPAKRRHNKRSSRRSKEDSDNDDDDEEEEDVAALKPRAKRRYKKRSTRRSKEDSEEEEEEEDTALKPPAKRRYDEGATRRSKEDSEEEEEEDMADDDDNDDSNSTKAYTELPTRTEDLPSSYTEMFHQMGFCEWNRKTLPCLIVSPFDFEKKSPFRKAWMDMSRRHLKKYKRLDDHNEVKLNVMVYWFVDNTYSIVETNKFIPYEKGKQVWKQVPQAILRKIKQGKSLNAKESMIFNGLEEFEAQAKKDISERRHPEQEKSGESRAARAARWSKQKNSPPEKSNGSRPDRAARP